MSARRARRLPAKVSPFRGTVSPVELSAGTKTEGGHQLSRRIEPTHIADLGGKSHSDEKRGATHRLVGLHDRRHRPLRHDESELFLEASRRSLSLAHPGRSSGLNASPRQPTSNKHGTKRVSAGLPEVRPHILQMSLVPIVVFFHPQSRQPERRPPHG
jgi:hypothetical protein